jgi:ABC-2 type transport system permease protein
VSTLAGTGRLVRLILRRDRVRLPLWLVGLGGVILASAASLPPVYPDQAAIDQYVALFGDNPALVAFAGPGYGFDDPNIGVILVNETQLWACLGLALMSIFLLNRHTRAEEDDERTDLLRSSVVGRHAPTAAAVAVVGAANVGLGAVLALGFVALDYPAVGSIALAASMAACGLAFTGVAAVAAQLAGSGRATLGLASAALGIAFLVRALGDIGDNRVRWLSPIGWAMGVRAFAGERWWPLAGCLVLAVGLVVGAFWLSRRRDPGAGMLPTRPGPARADRGLLRPLGLALRLQRGPVIGWSVGLFVTGVVYGSIGEDIEQMIEDNPAFADILAQAGGASLTDSFFAAALLQLGLLGSGYAISAVLRPRTEENAGRAESLLAGPVSRTRWAGGHLAVALAGTVLVLASGGFGTGLAYAAVSSDAGQVARLTAASLVALPAVLVLGGVAVALFGWLPRLALAAWGALAVAVGVGFFGELLRLPAWARGISPFHHLPAVPAEDLGVLPLVVVTALAAVLVATGLWGLRRRDVGAT